jgi:hypothetical protein
MVCAGVYQKTLKNNFLIKSGQFVAFFWADFGEMERDRLVHAPFPQSI